MEFSTRRRLPATFSPSQAVVLFEMAALCDETVKHGCKSMTSIAIGGRVEQERSVNSRHRRCIGKVLIQIGVGLVGCEEGGATCEQARARPDRQLPSGHK
jgi:hypothetical protein